MSDGADVVPHGCFIIVGASTASIPQMHACLSVSLSPPFIHPTHAAGRGAAHLLTSPFIGNHCMEAGQGGPCLRGVCNRRGDEPTSGHALAVCRPRGCGPSDVFATGEAGGWRLYRLHINDSHPVLGERWPPVGLYMIAFTCFGPPCSNLEISGTAQSHSHSEAAHKPSSFTRSGLPVFVTIAWPFAGGR